MAATPAQTKRDPTQLDSWLQILPDNTIAIRTGVGDFGQGTVDTSFRQVVAEELRVSFDAISELVTSDTDGGTLSELAAAVMSKGAHLDMFQGLGTLPDSPFGRNALNLQKAAAYAYQALLQRASDVLGAPVETLTVADGVIRTPSRSVTYAELVRDEPLDVRLELTGSADGAALIVLGTPPLVPVAEYRLIGTSCPNPRIPRVVQGSLKGVCEVRLPNMLHARVVHPKTFGSTLISVGTLDREKFPSAEVVVRGNLVAVVSPDEWEAVQAAQALAEATAWSEWRGLPPSDRLVEALLEMDWSQAPVASLPSTGSDEAFATAPRTLSSVFALPFYKHAPISPEVSVADVRDDGSVHVWAASQQLHALRAKLAAMLETEPENVVVHYADGSGSFGRTTLGDAGPEAEAVILSQACNRPVRVQWTREDDFAWSGQQPPYLGEVTVGLDDAGRMMAFKAEHYLPGRVDQPLLAAQLAEGRQPESTVPRYIGGKIWMEWPYDRVPIREELSHGADNVGVAESPPGIGLRFGALRSPMHLQQNFGVESMVSEAAAAAGADPIQYRLEHTTDERLISVLNAVQRLSGWETRPSPAGDARSQGGGVVRGRGVGVAVRHGSYLAGVAQIAIDLDTGKVAVERYWLAVDVGFVVNPRSLQLNMEGGSVMGISLALREELRFDGSRITSTDFRSYPILTMAEMPKIEIEIIPRPETMVAGQGSEPPNMVPPIALTGAFFDATGKHMRRLPLRPEYVLAELRND